MNPLICNIARCSLHDGEGVRTVVYLKGCNLRCLWCHNPEGIRPEKEILLYPSRCIKCGRCAELCPEHHMISGGEPVFIRDGLCVKCGRCADACPNGALLLCGEERTEKELLTEILKDKPYYDNSGGGVTFSGGECLLYPEFLAHTLSLCRKASVDTAVETALCVPWENIEKVMPFTDAFIVDIKHADNDKHRVLTGRGNGLILENLCRLSQLHNNICIRVPLIPTVNDDDENLCNTALIINSLGCGVKKVELLKYNNMAAGKYEALGLTAKIFAAMPQSEEEIRQKRRFFRALLREGIELCGE